MRRHCCSSKLPWHDHLQWLTRDVEVVLVIRGLIQMVQEVIKLVHFHPHLVPNGKSKNQLAARLSQDQGGTPPALGYSDGNLRRIFGAFQKFPLPTAERSIISRKLRSAYKIKLSWPMPTGRSENKICLVALFLQRSVRI